MKFTIQPGLFFPVELYFTLPGSLLILKEAEKRPEDRRSVTPKIKEMQDWLTKHVSLENNEYNFDCLQGFSTIPFCIVKTVIGTYVARPYANGKAFPLREDGFDSGNVLKGDVLWVSKNSEE